MFRQTAKHHSPVPFAEDLLPMPHVPQMSKREWWRSVRHSLSVGVWSRDGFVSDVSCYVFFVPQHSLVLGAPL